MTPVLVSQRVYCNNKLARKLKAMYHMKTFKSVTVQFVLAPPQYLALKRNVVYVNVITNGVVLCSVSYSVSGQTGKQNRLRFKILFKILFWKQHKSHTCGKHRQYIFIYIYNNSHVWKNDIGKQ